MNSTPPKPPRRAAEHWQKRLIIEGLMATWLENPELRLGQLLVNACNSDDKAKSRLPEDIFYLEDMDLGDLLLDYRNKTKEMRIKRRLAKSRT